MTLSPDNAEECRKIPHAAKSYTRYDDFRDVIHLIEEFPTKAVTDYIARNEKGAEIPERDKGDGQDVANQVGKWSR